jgi:hypothetical protein
MTLIDYTCSHDGKKKSQIASTIAQVCAKGIQLVKAFI